MLGAKGCSLSQDLSATPAAAAAASRRAARRRRDLRGDSVPRSTQGDSRKGPEHAPLPDCGYRELPAPFPVPVVPGSGFAQG